MKTLQLLPAVLLLAAPAFAGINGTTNEFWRVNAHTPMWSLADPFGFATLSNAESTASAALSAANVSAAAAAYAYSPTNPPPVVAATDTVARAVAAYAYSPTNKPPAITNYLFAAIYTNGAWWAVKIAPTP